MKIGIPKEIKVQEHRVGLVPGAVRDVTAAGHTVYVESGAGSGIGHTDQDYERAGAKILDSAQEIFEAAEIIVKVKEPQPGESRLLQPHHILFTFLHLAADRELTRALMDSGCTAIAYETVTDHRGGLPLLAPMSEIAGRLSTQMAAHYLQKHQGGNGRLLAGVPGVGPGRVLILGGGMAGFNAARMAAGLGAEVTILEKSAERRRFLDEFFTNRARILASSKDTLEKELPFADAVIGAVLIPGAAAPKLVGKGDLGTMQDGAVMVDIAIDQGGCFETSRPTSHEGPVYVEDGVVHYCVTNMPGAVPLTAAQALSQASLPFLLELAGKGLDRSMQDNPHLAAGLNIKGGSVVHPAVSATLGF